ncbi:MAG: RluA family pseudouridine synthase [Gammaproteobacteria bacterium]|nr:RluA family pseudouridine synthase [Gammaproteobacteria bacterium]
MTDLPATILWRDPGLLLLDKPSGVPVLADRSGIACLWDALTTYLAEDGLRPLAVHRIDKGTSGLLLVALNPRTQRALGQAFEAGDVHKWYVAISHGLLPRGSLDIDLPLAPGRKSRWRIAGPRDAIHLDIEASPKRYRLEGAVKDPQAKAARTRIRTLRQNDRHSLFSIRLHTGRTHQIRVHLSWLGAPLLGDHLYGRPNDPEQQAPRLALHCHRLQWPELGDGIDRPRTFRSPLPADFLALLPA